MTIYKWQTIAGPVLATMLMTGTGLADEAEDGADTEAAEPRDRVIDTENLKSGCFYTRDVNNWEAISRTQLIIYAPRRTKAYLITIAPPATSKHMGSTIGFEGRDRICGRAGDRVLLRGGMGRGYAVMDVRRLDEATLAAYEDSVKAEKDAKPVTPKESPGAEVETDIQPEDEASE